MYILCNNPTLKTFLWNVPFEVPNRIDINILKHVWGKKFSTKAKIGVETEKDSGKYQVTTKYFRGKEIE